MGVRTFVDFCLPITVDGLNIGLASSRLVGVEKMNDFVIRTFTLQEISDLLNSKFKTNVMNRISNELFAEKQQ
jgi:hypothetical protein